jgi:serine/threonine protein kinase
MAASKPAPIDATGGEGDDAASSATVAASARIGQTLGGKWKLERLLGAGGSAFVYAARHRNGRPVAIKVLHGDLARHSRVARRFLTEGYAANKVGHPGVVQILDDGKEPDGTLFLVMELLEGHSLSQRFEKHGKLAPDEVAGVAVGMLDVLAVAHDAGIVHRDIKPSNVFVTEEGAVKVLDFGAARFREADDFVTRSGTTLGTPAFMAPELAAGRIEDIDGRTDVWSVGATMFQLLTGRTVHAARSANEAIVTAATRPVPAIASMGPDLSPELAAAIDRALAFDKSERWPNARAMQARLLELYPKAAAGWLKVGSSDVSLPESRRILPSSGRRYWYTISFALVAIGAGLIATLSLRPREPAPAATASASARDLGRAMPSSVIAVDAVVPRPLAASSGTRAVDGNERIPSDVRARRPAPQAKPRASAAAPPVSADDGLDAVLDKRK